MENNGMASEKLYRNTLKPTYLRNRSIRGIFQPGYRLVQMNLHTLWQRYHSELYQGILYLLHKSGFFEKWCIGLHHWTDKSCTGLDQQLLRQIYPLMTQNYFNSCHCYTSKHLKNSDKSNKQVSK